MTDSDLPTSNDVFPPGSSTAGRRYKCLLAGSLVLLLLAGGEFSLRGPVRTLRPAGSQDFAVYYCCSRAWTEGSDPYSPENLQLIARRSGGAPESFLHNAVSPPATFVVLAPLTALPWAAAKSVWLAINIILLGVVLYEVIRLAGPGLGGAGKILICAFVLALAPLHT
ncbi:MAG: DUF2029 domain-containing protein, partial [Phycisphaerae bacterium]|nr:DUF2029 domain-containing protein [Phycisphaerae bacterium]